MKRSFNSTEESRDLKHRDLYKRSHRRPGICSNCRYHGSSWNRRRSASWKGLFLFSGNACFQHPPTSSHHPRQKCWLKFHVIIALYFPFFPTNRFGVRCRVFFFSSRVQFPDSLSLRKGPRFPKHQSLPFMATDRSTEQPTGDLSGDLPYDRHQITTRLACSLALSSTMRCIVSLAAEITPRPTGWQCPKVERRKSGRHLPQRRQGAVGPQKGEELRLTLSLSLAR